MAGGSAGAAAEEICHCLSDSTVEQILGSSGSLHV